MILALKANHMKYICSTEGKSKVCKTFLSILNINQLLAFSHVNLISYVIQDASVVELGWAQTEIKL